MTVESLLAKVRCFALPGEGPAPALVRIRQRGEFRLGPARPWMPFVAEQEASPTEVRFAWRARMGASRWSRIHVTDAYEAGRGFLCARLWGLLPVARARGPEIDRGEAQRYLAEIPLCPEAWRANPALSFAAPDERTLEVALAADAAARVAFEVAEDGSPRVVRAFRPYREGKTTALLRWRGDWSGWERSGAVVLPRRGEAAWLLQDGPFTYFRAEMDRIETADGLGVSG